MKIGSNEILTILSENKTYVTQTYKKILLILFLNLMNLNINYGQLVTWAFLWKVSYIQNIINRKKQNK